MSYHYHYATFTLPVHYLETISKPRSQSANYQHSDSTLPALYQHSDNTLPALYQHIISTVIAHYQHSDSTLQALYQHTISTVTAHHHSSITLHAYERRETETKTFREETALGVLMEYLLHGAESFLRS